MTRDDRQIAEESTHSPPSLSFTAARNWTAMSIARAREPESWTLLQALRCLLGCLLLSVLASSLSLAAEAPAVEIANPEAKPDDTPAALIVKPADETAAEPKAREEPSAPEELPQEDVSSAPEALLDAALDAMDQAVIDLEGDSPTPKVVQYQQDAVDRLKELLVAASQSKSSKSSKKNPPQPPSDSSDEKSGKTEKKDSADENGNGGRRADDENSTESSENVTGPTTPGSGVLAPGAKANSVWGHLPPRQQEALLRSLSDHFLPEYEAQIRRYYEALAEKK